MSRLPRGLGKPREKRLPAVVPCDPRNPAVPLLQMQPDPPEHTEIRRLARPGGEEPHRHARAVDAEERVPSRERAAAEAARRRLAAHRPGREPEPGPRIERGGERPAIREAERETDAAQVHAP